MTSMRDSCDWRGIPARRRDGTSVPLVTSHQAVPRQWPPLQRDATRRTQSRAFARTIGLTVHRPPPPRGSRRKHDPERRPCRLRGAPPHARPEKAALIWSAAASWVTMGRTRRAGQHRRGAARCSSTSPDLTGAPGHSLAGVSAGHGVAASGRGLHDRPGKGGTAMSGPRATGVWISAASATA